MAALSYPKMSPTRAPSPWVAPIRDSSRKRLYPSAWGGQLLVLMPPTRSGRKGGLLGPLVSACGGRLPVSPSFCFLQAPETHRPNLWPSECSILNADQLAVTGSEKGPQTFLCSHEHRDVSLWLSGYLKCPFQCSPGTRTAPQPALGAGSGGLGPIEKAK